MQNPKIFEENKYVVVKNALSEDAAKIAGNALLITEASGGLDIDEQQVAGASCTYGNPVMEAILLQLHKTVEENTGLELHPTYSFARIYRAGDILVKHTDRPSCEISATVTLNMKSDELWPIFVESVGGEDIPVATGIGDLMIYQGCEVTHWREAFEGDLWMQVFIHYINKNGPYYPEHAFDKRDGSIPNLYDFTMKYMR